MHVCFLSATVTGDTAECCDAVRTMLSHAVVGEPSAAFLMDNKCYVESRVVSERCLVEHNCHVFMGTTNVDRGFASLKQIIFDFGDTKIL